MWDLIVSVPDHCLFVFTLNRDGRKYSILPFIFRPVYFRFSKKNRLFAYNPCRGEPGHFAPNRFFQFAFAIALILFIKQRKH